MAQGEGRELTAAEGQVRSGGEAPCGKFRRLFVFLTGHCARLAVAEERRGRKKYKG